MWPLFVYSCIVIICVEEILGIKLGTLRGWFGWVYGIRNVHFVICIRCARHVAYTRLIKEQSKYLSGKLRLSNAWENWP
jgi:hypothetical protein